MESLNNDIGQLTDISSKHIFNLFLLEATFDDELIIPVNGPTRNTIPKHSQTFAMHIKKYTSY